MLEEEGRRVLERTEKGVKERGRRVRRGKESRMEEVEVARRSGGGTEEFIKNNIKNGRRERKQTKRKAEREAELYRLREKGRKKKSLHDSSYRFPQTVGVVKAG